MAENPAAQKLPSIQGLLWAQFTEAFSDNAWKLVVFTLATRFFLSGDGEWDETANRASQITASLSILAFLIPMLLCGLPAGILADRFSKRTIIVACKASAVGLMIAATVVLMLFPHNLWFPILILGLMGAQSAIFNPAKYGILPELFSVEQLSRANGYVQMATMVAIISGTGLGPILLFLDQGGTHPGYSWTAPAFLTLMACGALIASITIPRPQLIESSEQENQSKKGSLRAGWKTICQYRTLRLAVTGTALFWMITSLVGQNLLVYAKSLVYGLPNGELWQGLPPAAYGIGIALGALTAGILSRESIESGLIPLGGVLFAMISLFFGIAQPEMGGTVVLLILLGMAAGMLVVPLQALMQALAPRAIRGSILAISNTCDIVGLTFGSLFAAMLTLLGLSLQMTLIVSGLMIAAIALWAVWLLPQQLLRASFLIFSNCCLPIRLSRQQGLPARQRPLLLTAGEGFIPWHAAALQVALQRRLTVALSSEQRTTWQRGFWAGLFSFCSSDQEELLKAFHPRSDELFLSAPTVLILGKSPLSEREIADNNIAVHPVQVREGGNALSAGGETSEEETSKKKLLTKQLRRNLSVSVDQESR